jgi:hydrogenase nickel incorporation protein HypA/HybF
VHELSIAQSLLDSVRSELAARGNPRVTRVGMRVGEISGVQPDALQFSFEVIVKGTELEQAVLDIERIPFTYRCAACRHEFPVVAFRVECPACGGEKGVAIGGDELQLAYLEVE